jgi:hypothetical protein
VQVRYGKPAIDLRVIDECIEKLRTGLPSSPLPNSDAKRHLAFIWASKAVVATESVALGIVDSVTLRSVGRLAGSILYVSDSNWEARRAKTSDFGYCLDLLVACYAGRAIEEVEYGLGGTTLFTATEVALAGELAQWLMVHSELNPALFGLKYFYDEEDMSSGYMPMKPVCCCSCDCKLKVLICLGNFFPGTHAI